MNPFFLFSVESTLVSLQSQFLLPFPWQTAPGLTPAFNFLVSPNAQGLLLLVSDKSLVFIGKVLLALAEFNLFLVIVIVCYSHPQKDQTKKSIPQIQFFLLNFLFLARS